MKNTKFKTNVIFSYNLYGKILFAVSLAFTLLVLISTITLYFFVLKDSNFIIFKVINIVTNHLFLNVRQATLLGALYAPILGGLFFLFIPLEAIFVTFLKANQNVFLLIGLYLIGFLVSYTINYYIGMKLSTISKKIITPKKFYKIKNIVNKYGAWAIFFFNALPLPSQALSAILGVFRYNKARFYTFFMLGQLVKYVAISIGYFYIV
ncbi:MAG: VTT domain-containing protein [Nanoarchaeota archaeon]|nr:VTT domain-containing protein [Nanoarchaeota archaeon]MBU1854797.1 VTT domain-containing protein [Nanoarchaeota archaeon]